MCNACGIMCCGSDQFARCGCDGYDEPDCWSELEPDDEYDGYECRQAPARVFTCMAPALLRKDIPLARRVDEGRPRDEQVSVVLPGFQACQPRRPVQIAVGELIRPVIQQNLGRLDHVADRLRRAGVDPHFNNWKAELHRNPVSARSYKGEA